MPSKKRLQARPSGRAFERRSLSRNCPFRDEQQPKLREISCWFSCLSFFLVFPNAASLRQPGGVRQVCGAQGIDGTWRRISRLAELIARVKSCRVQAAAAPPSRHATRARRCACGPLFSVVPANAGQPRRRLRRSRRVRRRGGDVEDAGGLCGRVSVAGRDFRAVERPVIRDGADAGDLERVAQQPAAVV